MLWNRPLLKFQKPLPAEDFNRELPDDDTCLEYVKEQRFPGGMTHCQKCGKETKHHRIAGRTAYSCQYCGTQVYPLAGSIFEKSTTSLRTWFYALYLMGSTRCGISAKQIQRETGVTYKTAWRMFRQIRTLLSEDLQFEGPTVEIDELTTGYDGIEGLRRKDDSRILATSIGAFTTVPRCMSWTTFTSTRWKGSGLSLSVRPVASISPWGRTICRVIWTSTAIDTTGEIGET